MRALLAVSVIALTGAVCAPGLAQQSLHSQLEGTWKITAVYDQFTDGHKRNAFGENPQAVAEFTRTAPLFFSS